MDSQPLAKKDFHEAMEEFASIINSGFQEVHDEFQEVRDEIRAVDTKLDAKIEAVKRELLDSNAAIAKQIEDNRQEQAAAVGGRQRIYDTLLEHGDTLVDHSRRIGALEGRVANA